MTGSSDLVPQNASQNASLSGEPSKLEYRLHILDKKNYTVWKKHMTNVLEAKNLLISVQVEDTDKARDSQTRALLTSALSIDDQMKVINCHTAYKVWKRLEALYENKTSFEKEYLLGRLHTYKIGASSEVSTGISEMESIAAKLELLGEHVSEESLMSAILRALPKSFSMFITIWKGTTKSERTLDNLLARLMSEIEDQAPESSALVAGHRFSKYQKGRRPDNNRGNQSKEVTCYYCKKKGHLKKDCYKLKNQNNGNWNNNNGRQNNQGNNRRRQNHQGNRNRGNRQEAPAALMSIDKSVSIWVADSGASSHMTYNKKWLRNYEEFEEPIKVRMANHSSIDALGIGDIVTDQGIIYDVKYVPEASNNLFSESSCAMKGVVTETNDEGKIFKLENRELFRANQENGIYVIKFDVQVPRDELHANTALGEWHQRFGHISRKTIKKMADEKIVEGLKISDSTMDECLDCAINKAKRASHQERTSTRANKPGRVLHMDTVGPMIESLGGSKYFLLCKDEYSGYRIIKFMASKAMIPNEVKAIIAQAELETGEDVRKLVTDNGTEFLNKNLQGYLKERGINHSTTVAYTPEQNGYIERDNRTIQEAGRTMLQQAKLPERLWAEAMNCAVYTMNRAIKSGLSKTPYELWTGRKPNVANLKIFGQKAVYTFNEKLRESKVDTRGIIVRFVGYTDRYNTYRVYDQVIDDVFPACDLKFITDSQKVEVIKKSEDKKMGDNEMFESERFRSNAGKNQPPPRPPRLRKGSSSTTSSPKSPESIDRTEMLTPKVSPRELDESLIESVNRLSISKESAMEPIYENIGSSGELLIDPIYENIEPIENIPKQLLIKNRPPQIMEKRLRDRKQHHSANLSLLEAQDDPESYKDAMKRDDKDEWRKAMLDEIDALKRNQVWTLVDRPKDTNIVTNRWVLRIKRKPNGEIDRYRARLVARGFSQIEGIDYHETYAPVVNTTVVRLLFAYAAKESLKMAQFDVKTAFLYGYLDETIYMEQPEGFVEKEGKVCQLQKSLYGLKQAPRQWNKRFTNFLAEFNLKVSDHDGCVFYRLKPLCILAIYVDDGVIFARDRKEIDMLISKLSEEFQIHTVESNSYLGFQIERSSKNEIVLHQESYIKKILKKFGIKSLKKLDAPISISNTVKDDSPLSPDIQYRAAIGSLMYAAITTRVDIAYAVGKAARRVSEPRNQDWREVLRIFEYLCGHQDLGLAYNDPKQDLICYCDADFAGDNDTHKSTTGLVVLFAGAPIHWRSSRQSLVTLSSTEAEVVSLCTATKDVAWIRKIALELNMIDNEPTPILCDNQSATKIVSKERSVMRTRHLNAQNAYVYQEIQDKNISVHHVKADDQVADMLTKATTVIKFVQNRNKLMRYFQTVLTVLMMIATVSQAMIFDRVSPIVWTQSKEYVQTGAVNYKIHLRYTNPCYTLNKILEIPRVKRQAPITNEQSPGLVQQVSSIHISNRAASSNPPIMNNQPMVNPAPMVQNGYQSNAPATYVDNEPDPSFTGVQGGPGTFYDINAAVLEAINYCNTMFHDFITRPLKEINEPRGSAKHRVTKPRSKRGITDVLIGFFFSNVLNTMKDKFFPKDDHEERERESMLEKKLENLNKELNITELMINATDNSMRQMSNIVKHNERKLTMFLHVFPDVVFAVDYIVLHMSMIHGHLTKMRFNYRHKKADLYVLSDLLNTDEFDVLEPNSVLIRQLTSPRENTLEVEFSANKKDPWTFVYRVDGFRYWANLTGKPALMEYAGERYLIYNTSSNCVKAIDQPTQSFVQVSCANRNVEDKRLALWQKVLETDNPYEQPANTSVKGQYPYVYVYCYRLNITIREKTYKCPPYVFRLNATIPWNTTDINHVPDENMEIEEAIEALTLTHDVHSTHFMHDEHLVDENKAIEEITNLRVELDKIKKENLAITLPIQGGGLTNQIALKMTITLIAILLLIMIIGFIKKYQKDSIRHREVMRTVTDSIYGDGVYEMTRRNKTRSRTSSSTHVAGPAQVNVTLNGPTTSVPTLPPRPDKSGKLTDESLCS